MNIGDLGGITDPHVLVQIFREDDGLWSKEMCFSNYWLEELILVLQTAQTKLKRDGVKDGTGSYSLSSKDVVKNVQEIISPEE